MQAGINQWSLPVEDRDLLSILQLSVKSGIPNIELSIEPVGADSFGKLETDPELNEIFLNVARAVNAKKYLLGLLDSNAVLDTLKTTILKAGARVASVTTLDLFRYTLTSNDGKTREAASWIIKKMVDICAYMGGKIVLIEPGVVTSSLSYSDAYRNCEATMRDLAKYAEERKILLALENVWGKFLMSPLEFRALIDGTHSEAVGAYFDVANILEYGYPQDWIRILGGRIKSIHFKDYRLGAGIHGFCNPFDGDVDWFSVKRALEQTRYQGNIVAEIIKPKAWQEQFITELGRKLDYFIHEL